MKKYFTTILGALVFALSTPTYSAVILNGNFESGFSNWSTSDIPSPHISLAIRSTGFNPGYGIFTAAGTDGPSVASHGFDGGGGTISFAQDVGTIDLASALLNFDYRAGWDMLNYGGSPAGKLDRVFTVSVQPHGGGTPLQTFEVLRATGGSILVDTGNLSATLNLSDHVGSAVRISFDAFIPQSFTGPAFMQIDNITLTAIPEPTTALLAILGAAGLAAARRRRSGCE